jgi:hypothetical protein
LTLDNVGELRQEDGGSLANLPSRDASVIIARSAFTA